MLLTLITVPIWFESKFCEFWKSDIALFQNSLLQMFISGGGESDLYAVMARTGDKGLIFICDLKFLLKYCYLVHG